MKDKTVGKKNVIFCMFVRHRNNKFSLDCNIVYVDLCTTHKEAFAVGGVSKRDPCIYLQVFKCYMLINNSCVVIQFTNIHCDNNCLQKSA
jgi:hypothetical protein